MSKKSNWNITSQSFRQLIEAVRNARCGSIRPRRDVTFSMQWTFDHCLLRWVILRASSALLCSRASGPSSSAQLQVTESDVALFVPATRSDIFLLLRKSSAVTTTGEREVEGGGGEWDTTNLNRHFDSTVLYSTVQYWTCIPFFDFFGNRLQSCMLVNLARQVVMISTSKSYLVWGWRKRVIGDSMALSIDTFLF